MAHCLRCGNRKVRKNKKTGLRRCRHCGVLPNGAKKLNRDGQPREGRDENQGH